MDQFQLLDKGKEELKSAKIMSMELYAMTSGTDLMVMLSADSSILQLVCNLSIQGSCLKFITPRASARVKQSVYTSVVVVIVVSTKIARSRILGICVCNRYN